MMPDGVALRDIEDDCGALYHALVDLSPIIVLTWPPMRQPSLGTEGGQPPAQEQLLYLSHLGETERKWYLKQHEFFTSVAPKTPQEKLSDREFQVLRLIASGKIVSEIAEELSLSVKTISTYRSRILEKMEMKNNAELMHYAMQHQLVE